MCAGDAYSSPRSHARTDALTEVTISTLRQERTSLALLVRSQPKKCDEACRTNSSASDVLTLLISSESRPRNRLVSWAMFSLISSTSACTQRRWQDSPSRIVGRCSDRVNIKGTSGEQRCRSNIETNTALQSSVAASCPECESAISDVWKKLKTQSKMSFSLSSFRSTLCVDKGDDMGEGV